jgi:CRISPR-associated endonuclease/helicase Cas3
MGRRLLPELRRAFGRGVTATGCRASRSCPRAWASRRRSRWFSSASSRSPKLRSARTYIAGADFTQQPPELESGASRHVYGAYPMLCAAAVLLPRFGSAVRLPDDIPVLVGQAYGQAVDAPHSWSAALDDARRRWMDDTMRRTEKAKNFQISEPTRAGRAILGWVSGSVGEADDESQGQGQVGDGAPCLEAILV